MTAYALPETVIEVMDTMRARGFTPDGDKLGWATLELVKKKKEDEALQVFYP